MKHQRYMFHCGSLNLIDNPLHFPVKGIEGSLIPVTGDYLVQADSIGTELIELSNEEGLPIIYHVIQPTVAHFNHRNMCKTHAKYNLKLDLHFR